MRTIRLRRSTRVRCGAWAGMVCVAVLAAMLGSAWAQDSPRKAPDPDAKLKRMLVRFPEADADHDGVLTPDEARAFRAAQKEKRRAEGAGTAPGPGGPQSPAPDHANLKYGPDERNVLDVWLPKDAKGPVPVVMYIHGGGFTSGDKGGIQGAMLDKCLAGGMAVAAMNYRFVLQTPFPAPLEDGARAVQFLRYKAKELNLDPKRIALFGGSAGAGISMWVGFHDDMADASSADPVSRESTRITCIGSIGGQSSYNPTEMRDWVGDIVMGHPSVLKLYGVSSIDELTSPTEELKQRFEECSPIHHVSAGDPPIIMFYRGQTDDTIGGAVHSIVFGQKLKEALDALGIEAELHATGQGDQSVDQVEAMVAFFLKHFGMTAGEEGKK